MRSYSSLLWKKKSLTNETMTVKEKLLSLGVEVDESGHLFYSDNFNPINLNFALIFVRHGETYGNCGQVSADGKIDKELVSIGIKNKNSRIYQGNVDTEINQLTEEGKKQAKNVGKILNEDFLKKGWCPDFILISPLTRAKDTALPFVTHNKFEERCIYDDRIREMSFGLRENKRVCDLKEDDESHKFYREQHALIKSGKKNEEGECFCDVLLRAHDVLRDLNNNYSGKKIIMFSHSMFGAACSILLGRGQTIENGEYLAFDGKKQDGSYYTLPNATPILLTAYLPQKRNEHSILPTR